MLLYGMYLHLYYSCIIYVLPDTVTSYIHPLSFVGGGGGLVLEKRDLKRESHATQHLYTIIHSPLPTGYSLDLDLRQSQSPIESRTHVLL